MAEERLDQVLSKLFTDDPIKLDGMHFENCEFHNCVLVFTGRRPVRLVNCRFTDCHWRFEGPAANTLEFLQVLYDAGGGCRELIEVTFGIERER